MDGKTIVHLSCDFPDPLAPNKTRSVKNLVEHTTGFRHFVYSLNRVSGERGTVALEFGVDRVAVGYGAPPYGLWLASRLDELADWIAQDIIARKIPVDAFHAHKFSVEGLIATRLARQFHVPFIVNIWGDTDIKVVEVRSDLKPRWLEILRESKAIVPGSPWAEDRFETLFGLDRAKAKIIAPIVLHEHFQRSAPVDAPRFVTLFNLDAHKRKNLKSLIGAIVALSKTYPDIHLDVYGSGKAKTLFEIKKIISAANAEMLVDLKGPLDNAVFEQTLGSYVAFLMPTRRETFGMVFVEALFCGLPIMHSKGTGVDGLFDNDTIGYACSPKDSADIQHGVEHLWTNQARLKAGLAALHAAGGLDAFKSPAIAAAYRDVLTRVLAAP